MSKKSFFLPQYFDPRACTIFSKFVKLEGEIAFEMYSDGQFVEFNVPNYILFLPKSILNKHLRFGKIDPSKKKIVLRLNLSEDNLFNLVKSLGGTLKKKPNNKPNSPTLGDLLNL